MLKVLGQVEAKVKFARTLAGIEQLNQIIHNN